MAPAVKVGEGAAEAVDTAAAVRRNPRNLRNSHKAPRPVARPSQIRYTDGVAKLEHPRYIRQRQTRSTATTGAAMMQNPCKTASTPSGPRAEATAAGALEVVDADAVAERAEEAMAAGETECLRACLMQKTLQLEPTRTANASIRSPRRL